MAIHQVKGVIGAFVAGSLLFSSSAAMGASAPAPQADPWAVLTAMSGGAPAAAMCGAAAAQAAVPAAGGCVLPVMDAQPAVAAAVPPPPVPVAVAPAGTGFNPLLLGLLAVAAGVGIYLALHNNNHANSPA